MQGSEGSGSTNKKSFPARPGSLLLPVLHCAFYSLLTSYALCDALKRHFVVSIKVAPNTHTPSTSGSPKTRRSENAMVTHRTLITCQKHLRNTRREKSVFTRMAIGTAAALAAQQIPEKSVKRNVSYRTSMYFTCSLTGDDTKCKDFVWNVVFFSGLKKLMLVKPQRKPLPMVNVLVNREGRTWKVQQDTRTKHRLDPYNAKANYWKQTPRRLTRKQKSTRVPIIIQNTASSRKDSDYTPTNETYYIE